MKQIDLIKGRKAIQTKQATTFVVASDTPHEVQACGEMSQNLKTNTLSNSTSRRHTQALVSVCDVQSLPLEKAVLCCGLVRFRRKSFLVRFLCHIDTDGFI